MTIRELLINFGTKLKEDLQASIDAAIKENATKHKGDYGGNSRLANSVKFYFTANGDKTVFNLTMADYWDAFDKGRKAGKMPPIKPIEDWVKRRGFKTKLSKRKQKLVRETSDKTRKKIIRTQSREKQIRGIAFVIARSIGKHGTDGAHFFDKVIKDGRVEQLQKDISKTLKKEIIINLQKDGSNII